MVYPLIGSVGADMLSQVTSVINEKRSSKDMLCFILAADGGDTEYAFGIYDILTGCNNKTIIIACGSCRSAGILILQAADRRVSYPNTTFQLHTDCLDNVLTQHCAYYMKQEQKYLDLLCTRMKRVKRFKRSFDIGAMHERDSLLTAEEMIKVGLLDGII